MVGIVAALLGTALTRAITIPTTTSGIDWMELVVQVLDVSVHLGPAQGARST